MVDSSAIEQPSKSSGDTAGDRMPRRQATWTFDGSDGHNCYYISLGPERQKSAKTVPITDTLRNNGVLFDLDAAGNLIGVEIIFGPPQPESKQ